MNKRRLEKVAVLGMLIAILLQSEKTLALSGMMPETGVNIQIQKEWKGFACGYTEPKRLVIYTEDQWKEIWEKTQNFMLPRPELPKIDFEKEMIIAVFMGKQDSGGYEIKIKEISKMDKEIIVKVEEKRPASEIPKTMALTEPYHIVVIGKSSLPVRFQYQ